MYENGKEEREVDVISARAGGKGCLDFPELHLLPGSRNSFSSRYDSSIPVTATQGYLCMIGVGTYIR